MSKPYDASTKFLIETYFPDWLALTPLPATKAEVIDSDLSTVTASADKVLRVLEPAPWILHLELQASRDDDLSRRVHWYNALLEYRHDMPVHSLVVLLRREALSKDLTGTLERHLPGRGKYRSFEYQVLRLWEAKADDLLNAGIGLLPLAPLTDDAGPRLPEIVRQVRGRIETEVVSPALQGELLTATDILMGLRYEEAFIEKILRGVTVMRESVTYQAILREGRQEGLQEAVKALKSTLLELGQRKFGDPTPKILDQLGRINETTWLESHLKRILDVDSWENLLA